MDEGRQQERDHELYCPTCELSYDSGDRCPSDGTSLVRLSVGKDPLIGLSLDGRYTVHDILGAGAMGTVYRAEQHAIGRDVAVKVVNPALVQDPKVVRRFLREAKLASRLSHPNAVGVLDFGQTDAGLFYLVMEYLRGRTLDQVLTASGPLAMPRALRITEQICLALEGAHSLNIVHRDLKPSNVMIVEQKGADLVKVLDFGLAKSLSEDTTMGTVTGTGAVLGTPVYMSPEAATGVGSDARADLYSLGCILYEMVAGRPPFAGTSVPELLRQHATEAPPPITTSAPSWLASVIERLLAKKPGDRFPSAADVRIALTTQSAGEPAIDPTVIAGIDATAAPAPAAANESESETTPASPRRAIMLALLGAAALGGGGAAVYFGGGTSERPAADAAAPAQASGEETLPSLAVDAAAAAESDATAAAVAPPPADAAVEKKDTSRPRRRDHRKPAREPDAGRAKFPF